MRDPNTLKLPAAETTPADSEIRETRLTLLRAELATGHAFVRLALDATDNPEKRQRNRINAQTAHAAVLRFATRLAMSDEERVEITEGLEALRAAIAAIPES